MRNLFSIFHMKLKSVAVYKKNTDEQEERDRFRIKMAEDKNIPRLLRLFGILISSMGSMRARVIPGLLKFFDFQPGGWSNLKKSRKTNQWAYNWPDHPDIYHLCLCHQIHHLISFKPQLLCSGGFRGIAKKRDSHVHRHRRRHHRLVLAHNIYNHTSQPGIAGGLMMPELLNY